MAGYISKRAQAIANNSSFKNTETLENQHTTHRDILKFGNKIYERKCAELEKLREESLVELEVKLWQIANEECEKTVKETLEKAQQELKTCQENAKKEKDKAVKAECKRVEAYMRKQAQEQLQVASDEFQIQLREALHDARIEFEVEKMLAIRQSREEEINNAIEEAAKVANIEEKQRKIIIVEAEKDKNEALKQLRMKTEQEAKEKVAEIERKCREVATNELQQCKQIHSVEIEKLHERIKQQERLRENVKKELSQKENIRKKTEIKLREVVEEFQNFIDVTKGFTKGQSEFLLPDMNLLQDMLNVAVISSHEINEKE